ncbi:TonB-dependent receptor plug domain-containing protein [Niveispirillum fermenti]|uniref:TonB-dependent receptor plug domain-containing protein n=1 Tax=Niveispirillum fermenti TaxID=1233113 RepID=UPI003A84EB10
MTKGKKAIAGLRGMLLVGAAVGMAGAAAAQDANLAQLEEIVVTGSRIARSNLNSSVPLNVVTETEIRFAGFTNLADAVSTAPQMAPSLNGQSSGGFLFVGGQSRVDLRGLGTNRTLVLVDGKRHVTGALDSPAVDLNTIPSSMVQRTEIITGGASAVYGSEAVAGVVNILLRKDLEGAEFDASYGISEYGDGQEMQYSGVFGSKFHDGKGYVMAGIEYTKVDSVLAKDRKWASPGITFNTLVSPNTVVPNPMSRTGRGGVFRTLVANPGSGPLAANAPAGVSIDFESRSVQGLDATCLTPRNNPTAATPFCNDPSLDYTSIYTTLQGESERLLGRAYGSYELNDFVKITAEIGAASVDSKNPLAQPAFTGSASFRHMVRRDNAFLNGNTANAVELRRIFDANGLTSPSSSAELYRFTEEFGQRVIEQQRDMIRTAIGLEGDFELGDRKVKWDTYYQYGQLDGKSINRGQFHKERYTRQLDSVIDPATGQPICRDLLSSDAGVRANAAGCIPFDWLNGASQAAIDYSKATSVTVGQASQQVAAVNLTTDLFELPAGNVGIAVGAEYREEKSDQETDSATAQGLLFTNAIPRRKGAYDVKEFYAEMLVPLLKDMFLVKELTLDGAYRWADYSTVGGVDQWKVGLDFTPIDDIRFRGTYSESVRAPNIIELYAPTGENFTTAQQDPCDRSRVATLTGDARSTRVANCSRDIAGYDPLAFESNIGTGRSSLRLLQGGNANLREELAKTYTLGAVIQPTFLEGFAATVDYYDINIKDAINLPALSGVFQACYDTVGGSALCSLITRDATGARTNVVGGVDVVQLTQANIASFKNRGIDFSVAYGFDLTDISESLGEGRRLDLSLQGTHLLKYDFVSQAGQAPRRYAGTSGTPSWKLQGTATYSDDALTFSWTTRFEDNMVADEALLPIADGQPLPRIPFYTGDYWAHDVRVLYKVTDDLVLRAGVQNVTNERPPNHPTVYTGTGNGTSANWDNRGRYFYGGVNVKF